MENKNTFETLMFLKEYENQYNTKKMLFLIENPNKTEKDFVVNQIEQLNQKEIEFKRKCDLSDEEVYQEIKKVTRVANLIRNGIDKNQKKEFDEYLKNEFLEFRKKYIFKEKKEDSLRLKFYKTKLENLPPTESKNEEIEKGESIPYKIAMYKKIGFFELDIVKKMSKEEQYDLVQMFLEGSHRIIKGNILVLDPKSNEDRLRYTANDHLKRAQDYLDKRK